MYIYVTSNACTVCTNLIPLYKYMKPMCTFLYEYECHINWVVVRPYSKMCVAPSLDLRLQRCLLILIEDFGDLWGAISKSNPSKRRIHLAVVFFAELGRFSEVSGSQRFKKVAAVQNRSSGRGLAICWKRDEVSKYCTNYVHFAIAPPLKTHFSCLCFLGRFLTCRSCVNCSSVNPCQWKCSYESFLCF